MMPSTPTRLRYWAFLSVMAVGGCFQGPGANEVQHPTPENAAPSGAVQITQDALPSGMSSAALANWKNVRDEIVDSRIVLRIGAKDTDGPDAFGNVVDVAVNRAGHVFVLDDQAQEVRIFDPNGGFMQSLGGIGDGPSEFRYANGITLLRDGRLVVSARGPQLKYFERSDRTWVLQQIVQVPAISRDVCLIDEDRIFVAGYKRDNNTVVHEVADSLGRESRDFGDAYRDDQWLVRMRMSEGMIECIEKPRAVIFAFRGLPIVRAHSPDDGSVIWSSVFVDFVPQPVLGGVRGTGQPYVRQGQTDQWDIMGAIHDIRPGYILVQTGRFDRLQQTVKVRSYLLDASSGRGAFIGDTSARVFPSPHGHVEVLQDPYPRLEVRVSPQQGTLT